ncbi:MAG: efflux RND transporter permease subunit [Cellvibrio sp.]
MKLSDVSIKRPVFASVISLLLVAFGLVAFDRLTLREYPDIDPPVVSIRTAYPGAAAAIIETRITKVIEDQISGVQGLRYIESSSENGVSNIVVTFATGYDMDAAANDIRDRVSRTARVLPDEADTPEVQKVSSDEDPILWFNFTGEGKTVPELSDYASRYLVDRFSTVDGVARVRIGGEQRYAMRLWLDRNEMAARNVTVDDIESVLRAENIELPAGSIESVDRQFTLRMTRGYREVNDFENLVIRRGDDGYLLRLKDVAKVERGTTEDRNTFRGNGVTQVGIGIVKQSTANTIDVARGVKAERDRINEMLPDSMRLEDSFDSSVFIERAVEEVYMTLAIALLLVVFIIYLFLGSARAMLVPAIAVPVSIIATFIVLAVLGFSVNMLTLLALVLAIGLVVDDAIVVLENIVRHMQEKGKPALLAAIDGTREVGFAVIATTLVLIAIFVPIVFLKGDIGRLFSEFAITMAAAVAFSSLVALTLSPMLCSKLLRPQDANTDFSQKMDKLMLKVRKKYTDALTFCISRPVVFIAIFVALLIALFAMASRISQEYAPKEDRGTFFIQVNGPEGASFSYMEEYMAEIESRMMPLVDKGYVSRLMVRAPRGFGTIESFNTGNVNTVLTDWSERPSAFDIMEEVRKSLNDLTGVTAIPIMRQGFGSATRKPVQFVIGGGSYEELAEWRDILLEKIDENNPGLVGIDWDYKETKPQVEISVNPTVAADLGVSVTAIGRTLEAMLGSRKATTYINDGEEYDVIMQAERAAQRTIASLQDIYVRSTTTGELIPLASLVTLKEVADASKLNRYNRKRTITLEANLADDLALGDALDYLNGLVREHLPAQASVDYKGLSRDFQTAGSSIFFIFALGILITFLVLAAQFESYIHPFVILSTVPLAMLGGVIGIYVTGGTFNLYSQIGLIMLVGLAAKNGILIVEFANQMRDRGIAFTQALLDASSARLRPIIMTSLTSVVGAIPLVISSGAGSETRFVIGVVVIFGVLVATFLTLFFVPLAYSLIAKNTGSPNDVARELDKQDQDYRSRVVTGS